LYAAWNTVGIDTKDYAEFVILTNYNLGDYYGYIDGKLFIKATDLLVNDTNNNRLFEAGGNKVFFAGWNAQSGGLT
jgi:hypothetical protein